MVKKRKKEKKKSRIEWELRSEGGGGRGVMVNISALPQLEEGHAGIIQC